MITRNTLLFMAIGLATLSLGGCGEGGKTKNSNDSVEASAKDTAAEGDVALGRVIPIIEKASNGNFTVKNTFPGPEGSGFLGVVLEPKAGGAKQIGWASKDGYFVTPGPLFDKDGANLNEKALSEHGGMMTPDQLAQRLLDGNVGFIAGKSGPTVTVFFEPYCGYCNGLYKTLKPNIDSGKMKVRFVLVPFLRPDSASRSADIMNAKDPYKALEAWEGLADKDQAKASTASEEDQAKIRSNGALFNEAGLNGTPVSLICNKTTNKLEIVRGSPPDAKSFLDSIGDTGHAICKS